MAEEEIGVTLPSPSMCEDHTPPVWLRPSNCRVASELEEKYLSGFLKILHIHTITIVFLKKRKRKKKSFSYLNKYCPVGSKANQEGPSPIFSVELILVRSFLEVSYSKAQNLVGDSFLKSVNQEGDDHS